MEVTYVVVKPVRVGGETRPPGALVPEAADWFRPEIYIARGKIAPVPIEALGEKERAVYDAYRSAKEEQERAEADPPEDADPSPSASTPSQHEDALTIEEVKSRVESGQWDVAETIEHEEAGKERSTLLEWLYARLDAEG